MRDCHRARSNLGQPKKRFSNPKKRYPCSDSLSISISSVDALDRDNNQPIFIPKYQHTHIHRPPIDKQVDPEIIQFIEEHKLNPPADIERVLRRDVRFTSCHNSADLQLLDKCSFCSLEAWSGWIQICTTEYNRNSWIGLSRIGRRRRYDGVYDTILQRSNDWCWKIVYMRH